MVDRLESRVGTLVERATNAFRQVTDMHQLKAGRLRTLVKGAMQLKTAHATIKTREEIYIDGKQIHLG